MLTRYLDAEVVVDVQATHLFDVPKMLSEFKRPAGKLEIADQDDYHHFLQIYNKDDSDFLRYSKDTLYFLLDGKVELEFKGHEPIELVKYDCLRVPKGVVYRVKTNEKSTVMRFQAKKIRAQKI